MKNYRKRPEERCKSIDFIILLKKRIEKKCLCIIIDSKKIGE